jgi:hypothetical protein
VCGWNFAYFLFLNVLWSRDSVPQSADFAQDTAPAFLPKPIFLAESQNQLHGDEMLKSKKVEKFS